MRIFDVIFWLWWKVSLRPLFYWVLAVVAYLVLPVPRWWVLLLVVGLGAALTVTVLRLHNIADRQTARVWMLAERLVAALEFRIRGYHNPRHPRPAEGHWAQASRPYGVLHPRPRRVYDPGVVVSAVVAVLAAEGLPTQGGPALVACAHLLGEQGIRPQPGAPAPTARSLVGLLRPGPQRPHRVMPPALLAGVIRAVLTQDRALPQQITTDAAENLLADSALILQTLHIQPDENAGALDAWPIMARIIDAAAQLPPHPPPARYTHWKGWLG